MDYVNISRTLLSSFCVKCYIAYNFTLQVFLKDSYKLLLMEMETLVKNLRSGLELATEEKLNLSLLCSVRRK